MAQWDQAWSAFYLIGRCFAAALGTATVFVVYRLTQCVYGTRCARIASLFLALSFLHARDSHFGVTDVPVTLLICLTMLALADAAAEGDPRQFFVAGLLAGFATAVKYNAALLVAPAAIASLVRPKPDSTDVRVPQTSRGQRGASRGISVGSGFSRTWQAVLIHLARLLAFAAAFVPAFLLGTPYALLDPHALLEGVQRVSAHLERGHGVDLGPAWLYHLMVSLRYGLGWPVLAAGLIGIAITFVKNRRLALLLWSFPVAYFAAASSGRTVFIRYIIPVLPFLCIAAAVTVDGATRALARRVNAPARVHAILPYALALLMIVPSAVNLVRADILLARADNRLLVTDWLRERVAHGASLYQTDLTYGRLELEDPGHRPWFDAWDLDAATGMFTRRDVPQPVGPDWIVVQRSQVRMYSRVPAPIERLTASGDYVRVRSFTATELDAAGNVYDQQDAFFLPIAGFHAVRRPGPNFDVYQRRSGRTAIQQRP
jgi:hypothetical protein